MALELGDGNWAWVLGHAGVWALVLARVRLVRDGPGTGGARAGLAVPPHAGRGSRRRVDPPPGRP